jgi:cell division protein FtsW
MKKIKYHLSTQSNTLDFPLLGVVILLTLFGLIMVYDASIIQAYRDFGDSIYYIRQQLIWSLLGAGVLLFFLNFPYQSLKKFAIPALLVSSVLLIAVFIPGLGVSVGGAHRWLNLGFATIQPAEVFKFWAVIALASWFIKIAKFRVFLMVSVIGVLLMGLLQRDLGSAIVFAVTSSIIYIASGGAFWKLALGFPIGLAAILGLIITSEYRRKRVLAFLDPFSDPQGFTYHISQVLIALGSGGLSGLGLGQSRQKFEYIPEVTTDSIFAIVGEELGFFGGLILILLFAFLIVRGFKIAENCPDKFGQILAIGLTSWLGVQAIINLSAMVALIPLTGVPLPFISYGGSALVANLAAVGILLNISRRS